MLLKRLARDTVIYGGGDLVGKLIAFFTFPVIAAALSPRAFGTLDLITTSVGLASLLMNCGLNNAVQRFYWDEGTPAEMRPVLVSTGLYTEVFFGVLLALFFLPLMPFVLAQAQKAALPFGAAGLFAALALLFVTQVIQYLQDVTRLQFAPGKFLALSLLGRVLIAGFALIAVVFYGAGIDGLLAVQAAVGLIVIAAGLYLVRRDIVPGFDRAQARMMVQYGYPFIFMGLAYWLFGSMDRWMLSAMSSIEETGIYSVAFRFATIVLFASAAFGQAWSPHAVKIKTDYPETYRVMYAQILLLLVYCMLVIGGGLALFSGEMIGLLMPPDYAGSAIPLTILCFAIILQATQQITAIGISLERKTHILSRLAWVAALVNLVGNYLLIPPYGASGAAWATCLSYLVLTSGYFFWSQRLHPIPVAWGRLSWLAGLGLGVLAVSILWNAASFDWNLIAIKLLFACVCMALGWVALPLKDLKHAIQT